jgi:hypothetical protein
MEEMMVRKEVVERASDESDEATTVNNAAP